MKKTESKQILNEEFKRMQKLAGLLNENKIPLYTDDIFSNPDASHIISNEENKLIYDYFKEEQDEEIEDITGKTAAEAAEAIGPEDYKEETLQHILVTLFPDRYERFY
jgi:hypothetical protein